MQCCILTCSRGCSCWPSSGSQLDPSLSSACYSFPQTVGPWYPQLHSQSHYWHRLCRGNSRVKESLMQDRATALWQMLSQFERKCFSDTTSTKCWSQMFPGLHHLLLLGIQESNNPIPSSSPGHPSRFKEWHTLMEIQDPNSHSLQVWTFEAVAQHRKAEVCRKQQLSPWFA